MLITLMPYVVLWYATLPSPHILITVKPYAMLCYDTSFSHINNTNALCCVMLCYAMLPHSPIFITLLPNAVLWYTMLCHLPSLWLGLREGFSRHQNTKITVSLVFLCSSLFCFTRIAFGVFSPFIGEKQYQIFTWTLFRNYAKWIELQH